MVDHELKKSVIRDVALLKLVGFRPIIVHGGGKEITKWINKVGLETNFVNGLRVTDAETMEVGQNIRIYGRIQSRNYQKKLSEDKTDVKTAYEVSISKMEVEKLQEASGE